MSERGKGATDTDPEMTPEASAEALIEMRGELKAYLRIINQPDPPFTPEEQQKTAGIRDLVGLHRELRKQEDGEPYNELIVSNAELLEQTALNKLGQTARSSVAPAAVVHDPAAVSLPPVIERPPQMTRDKSGKLIPAFKLDRRTVARKPSSLPRLGEIMEEYLEKRRLKSGPKGAKDIKTARARLDVFIELIGDHPVDTYNPTDLQAFIELMQFWPGDNNLRDPSMSAMQIIEGNRDLHLQPLTLKSLQEGYLAVVKAAIRSLMTEGEYPDPFAGTKLVYPSTAAVAVKSEPLATEKISQVFRAGVASGLMEDVMLPLLGHLTGRRIGLLIHLTGNDFREKFSGVWVAQLASVKKIDGVWVSTPHKTDASTTYFVLHEFLSEIGFIEWAVRQKGRFLFPNLMRLADPSKSASSYMNRLFERAGIKQKNRKGEDGESGGREVFHSLRGGNIDDMRNAKIEGRARRMQSGHQVGSDEHDNYGFMNLGERQAREIAALPLDPGIDFSVFRGLDFDRIARKKRLSGPKPQKM
ncbi:hypothetical protein [Agrobacterium larrymoorei]|uniref:Integrase n=1 Tax=Agrobacterium larrymoorei TaxID=160699 RepID=A0ABU0UGX6_9HYPH|nr:hypothetical protein [Agrobacterium larrymoorei]MDQ1184191.1 integrase [Agrobacterium larrymoorei]